MRHPRAERTVVQRQRLAAVRACIHDERGLSTVEYVTILVLIAALGIGLWRVLGAGLTSSVDASSSAVFNAFESLDEGDPSLASDPSGVSGPASDLTGSAANARGAPSTSRSAAVSVVSSSNGNSGPGSATPSAPGGAERGASSAPGGAERRASSAPGTSSGVAADNAASSSLAPSGDERAAPPPAPPTSTSTSSALAPTSPPPPSSPGLLEQARDYIQQSAPVQTALGVAAGTLQALAPGGFLLPSPWASSQAFETGRGVGQLATGVVQIITGGTMAGGGGAAAAGGVVAAPATAGGSLLVTGGGAVVAVEGAAIAVQGATNVAAAIDTLTNAMAMTGAPGSAGPAVTNPSGTPGGRPSGTPTKIPPGEKKPENIAALTRENESAQTLARKGYKVEQNPTPAPGSRKNPDYKIEGEYFDNMAPGTSNARNIWARVKEKVVDQQQAKRIVLNLDDSKVEMAALQKQFKDWPVPGLEEVLVLRGGEVTRLFP